MTLGEIVIAIFVLAVSGGLGALGWRQFGEIRQEMREGFARVDRRFEQQELQFVQIRQELGTLRSDLTHVALAVGARPPPQASEG